jgi:rubrerythrin
MNIVQEPIRSIRNAIERLRLVAKAFDSRPLADNVFEELAIIERAVSELETANPPRSVPPSEHVHRCYECGNVYASESVACPFCDIFANSPGEG